MPKRILLADDSAAAHKSVEKAIGSDYQLIIAEDGRSAVEQIKSSKPHLVLAHAMLPEVDGYEVCRQVKDTSDTSHIPVYLLTGTFEPFDINRAKEAHYDGFITKPVDDRELLRTISTAIDGAVYPAEEPAAEADQADEPAEEAGDVSDFPTEPATTPGTGSDAMLDRIFPEEEPQGEALSTDDPLAESGSPEEDIFSIVEPMAEPAEETVELTNADEEAPAEETAERSSPDFGIWGGSEKKEETVEAEEKPAEEASAEESDLSWFLKKYEDKPQEEETSTEPETITVDTDEVLDETLATNDFFSPPLESETTDTEDEPLFEVTGEATTETEETVAPALEAVEPLPIDPEVSETGDKEELPDLDDKQVDRIARRVVELLSDTVVRDVAWEAVPEIAERLIRERIKEIETEADTSS